MWRTYVNKNVLENKFWSHLRICLMRYFSQKSIQCGVDKWDTPGEVQGVGFSWSGIQLWYKIYYVYIVLYEPLGALWSWSRPVRWCSLPGSGGSTCGVHSQSPCPGTSGTGRKRNIKQTCQSSMPLTGYRQQGYIYIPQIYQNQVELDSMLHVQRIQLNEIFQNISGNIETFEKLWISADNMTIDLFCIFTHFWEHFC